MSLITRCPACTTMFKVVPDQLRVSGGWVRCGHCQEVFDASANLQSPAVVGGASSATESTPPAPSPKQEPEAREPFLEVNPRALYLENQELAEPTLRVDVEPDAPFEAPVEPEPPVAAKDPVPPDHVPDDDLEAVVEESTDDAQAVPSFAASRKRKVRRSLWVTGLWGFGAILLGVSLGVQALVHERDRIAATEPSALAVLRPLCDVLGCSVAPLRQIESVVIDSSAFTKVRGDVYRLTVTYKNTAAVPLETPALELTLTDLQDQPVVRRVFGVQELGLQRPTLDAGGEQAVALQVALKAGGAEKISGYRLLAFYP